MFPKDAASRAKVVKEVVKAYTYVLLWMCISIAVIMFNKWVLAYSGFPFPIALTLWHMFFCSTVGILAVRVLKVVKSHNMTPKEYYTRVLPIGLLYAGSLWLSNSAYLYLSVSFIQMTKSLMPGLVYASGVLLGTEKYSKGTTLNMLLIAFGVVICALGEMNLVIRGLIQQLAALGFEAMRLTMVQVLINSKGYNMNPIQSLYYVSPACFLCLLVPFLSVEMYRMKASHDWVFNPSVMLANALTAFILNLAVFLLIGKTSALTMNIAGVIKDWMLIFFSFYIFKAPVTALNLAGYAFCCSGVVVYNHMKLQAIKAKVASQGKDEEKQPLVVAAGHAERSKEDILSEIRRLQSEMAMLEDRVQSSAKIMNGSSGALNGDAKVPSNPTPPPHELPQGDKDK
mmetsp:Transcript_7911/g.16979  ORF Transcript_7911/g.16979 Transcript_7911/m.16979 type:complete len:399 (+) Transcript_7911:320-1516(+)|eukprot:CAMPEP_0202898294 /NCGR_PEP_ID=MMETSP1392-20130828/6844_1 /ASSEMBLY_ACC=CAM_ASM_000868 /TAXON_ID=225041 /ORGANISM="Chlamydomonas chlamydogama, Strain SAG 11-48b" /LENGTH=398 /DNA_ID=CAMNT_0049584169 /DNA_START=276 /DNA_END=1472 /DNA_ORIENTATION=-